MPLWVVLLTISVIIFAYMLFFADQGERAITQAMLMGSVMSVMVLLLFLIQFLDNPLHPGLGGLRPVAMERTIEIMDQAMALTGVEATPPCDELGNRR